MPSIRFSIIVTFHNQREFIREALESALSQRRAGFEVIAIDDASTDGTPEILQNYDGKIKVKCLETNEGACSARNRGAALATGEYLVFLDGDDAFLPWALDVYERIVQAKKPALLLAGMSWFKGPLPALQPADAPREITLVEYPDYFRRDRGFGHSASAMVIVRQAFEDVHGWLEGFFPAEDNEMAMRLGTCGRVIQILSPLTILHRAHAGNSINSISSFIPAMKNLMKRERQGHYPGGARRRFERRALLGGMVLHWARRAAKNGLYGDAMDLMLRSSPMLLAAAARRLGVIIGGRQRTEMIKL